MPDIHVISQAIDFIETHLTASITVADMADSASYSLFHFCRVFNQVTHLTPYDYLIRRRLAESSLELVNSDRKILEIALDYQFSNPETYSRAFRRMFGILPSAFRKGSTISPHSLMPRWTEAHLQHIEQNPDLFPNVVQRESIQLAGLMTLLEGDHVAIPALWKRFLEEVRLLSDQQLREYFAISFLPDANTQISTPYFVGVGADSFKGDLGPLVIKEIPSMRVARFIHRGRLQDRRLTLDYAYYAWLPRSGEQLSHPWVIETISEGFWETEDDVLETIIDIPIV